MEVLYIYILHGGIYILPQYCKTAPTRKIFYSFLVFNLYGNRLVLEILILNGFLDLAEIVNN